MNSGSSDRALWLLLLLYLCNHWSRHSLIYMGNVAPPDQCDEVCGLGGDLPLDQEQDSFPLCPAFDCQNDKHCLKCESCLNDTDFGEISLSYGTCLSPREYGFLSSYGYTLSFMLCTLFSGKFANFKSTFSRKLVVVICGFGWAGLIFMQALSRNFLDLLFVRIFLGAFEAISTPCSLSLLADWFPEEVHAQKDSIFMLGVYLGDGFGSASILLADLMGYKYTCYLIAINTIVWTFGLVLNDAKSIRDSAGFGEDKSLLEHEKLNYDTIEKQEKTTDESKASEVLERTSTYRKAFFFLFLASGMRYFGAYTTVAFLPTFFKRRYPSYNESYSTLNAIFVVIFGSSASYFGGVISDHMRSNLGESYRAYVPAVGSLLGLVPLLSLLLVNSFYLSIIFLPLEILLGETWMGSAIAILQRLADDVGRKPGFEGFGYSKGTLMALYFFFGTLIGSLGPVFVGFLDDGRSVHSLQFALIMTVLISYIGAAICFFSLGMQLRKLVKTPIGLKL